MLRKLVIRFVETGDYFREIDETRCYFLSEAEEIVEMIRHRLIQEKRTISPKPFEFWIDGQQAVISQVYFEKNESLEKQLLQTIEAYESWSEEMRHKIVNTLKDYAEEERQYFLNREFHTFAVRYDQLYGASSYEPFPIHLDITHLNQLYIAVQKHVTTGFYAELEQMMTAIGVALQKVLRDSGKSIESDQQMDFQQRKQLLEASVYERLRDAEVFGHFIQYVAAHFQSVPQSRIEALCPHFKQYQILEQLLFKTYAKEHGFSKAYRLHLACNQALQETYDAILEKGFALANDEMVESLVLSPVIQQFIDKVEVEHVGLLIEEKSETAGEVGKDEEPSTDVSKC